MTKPPRPGSLLKPGRLVEGDLLGVVAPSSPPPDPRAVDRAVEQVERLGFRAQLGRHVRRRHGFLAGSDRERAGDLMAMFGHPQVRGILCLRGGYGAARLLDHLDYAFIRAHPKVFAGYSDITSLHCALLVQAGLVTFHGPMLNEGFGARDYPPFSVSSFKRTTCVAEAAGSLCTAPASTSKVVRIRCGVADGRLVGGNLSVLATTLGTPQQPSFRNRILFLEDIGEQPYRLDRLLTHLMRAGPLRQVAGVAFGVNKDCEDPRSSKLREYRQSSLDVLRERLAPLGVPVVAGLPFGHQSLNATLPLGVKARLDANRGDLVITEAAVR